MASGDGLPRFRCLDPQFDKKEKFKDDGIVTPSSVEQVKVEESLQSFFDHVRKISSIDENYPLLLKERHVNFLKKGILNLSESYECLDAGRPWLCYWIVHSLELLDEPISEKLKTHIAQFLEKCQDSEGGFGGGPGQQSHLAPTYAAINALCILGTEEAYQIINREKLQDYLFRMKRPDGSFCMHEGGEVDIRGVYCAISVARLTNVASPELFEGTGEWITRCQTYEGGFGGVPDLEAHGGYTFCGFASLVLLRKAHLCNVNNLLRWVANKQMRFEGGFQGRTNKLVDGCYSFWQGGTFPLIHHTLSSTDPGTLSSQHWLFNQKALQEYLLICCQFVNGGLIDKPGKNRDFYHTCYTLSGLSVAQHCGAGHLQNLCVIGDPKNELSPTHPLFNIGVDAAFEATQYFTKLPVPASKKVHTSESSL